MRDTTIFVLTVVCLAMLPLGRLLLINITGTPLFGQGMKADGTPEETTVLRAGILEDSQVLTEWKPQAELYTDRRLEWVPPIEGAAQCSAMIPL
jgi:hypothetical protein